MPFLACIKHFFYDYSLTKEVNCINKTENVSEDDIEFYKKVVQYCKSNHFSLEKDYDIIEAIVMNSFNVPIAGIYYLDGWFNSARYDKDRFESDYISINPRFANQIMHYRTIEEGDYIVVIDDQCLTLKKEIRDFQGRIIRDAINTTSYFARLIKITEDHVKEYAEMSARYNREANEFARKQVPFAPNKLTEEVCEQYNNARKYYMQQFGDLRKYYDYTVKGKVIEKKYLKTIASLSYIYSRLLQQEQVYNVGDIAYTSTDHKVKVLEKTEKGYLVEDQHSGLIGEESRLYDAASAYFMEYFSGREKSCTLKWQKDKEIGI